MFAVPAASFRCRLHLSLRFEGRLHGKSPSPPSSSTACRLSRSSCSNCACSSAAASASPRACCSASASRAACRAEPFALLLLDSLPPLLVLPFELRLQPQPARPSGLLPASAPEGRLQGKALRRLLLDGLLLPFELRLQLRSRSASLRAAPLRNRLGPACCAAVAAASRAAASSTVSKGLPFGHEGAAAVQNRRLPGGVSPPSLWRDGKPRATAGHRQVWPEAAVLCVVTMGRRRE